MNGLVGGLAAALALIGGALGRGMRVLDADWKGPHLPETGRPRR